MALLLGIRDNAGKWNFIYRIPVGMSGCDSHYVPVLGDRGYEWDDPWAFLAELGMDGWRAIRVGDVLQVVEPVPDDGIPDRVVLEN